MVNQLIKSAAVLLMGSAVLSACTSKEPYIERLYEIDREHVNFPNGPKIVDGTPIVVCYSKSYTTPAQIRDVANKECALGGLNAEFKEQTYNKCSLIAPVAAVFTCSNSAGVVAKPQTSTQAVTPANSVSAPASVSRPLGSLGAADVSTTAKSAPFPTFLFNNGQSTK